MVSPGVAAPASGLVALVAGRFVQGIASTGFEVGLLGAALFIADRATGDHAVATCVGGQSTFGSGILFQDYGSAGEGHYTAIGGSSSDEEGGVIEFDGLATAANGTFVVNGGMGAGLLAYL